MQQDGFGHERKYHRCFLRFKRSSRQLSSQRGTEASGGCAAVGERCYGRSSHWFWEIDHISKLRSFHSFSAICRFFALLAFSFPSLSCYQSRRLCKSFKPQDSVILIFLVDFVAAILCYDEILLRYVDFSRMKFNRYAAFLIFNAHFEQTREDKYGSEFKQTSRVPVIILLRGRFPALAFVDLKRFSPKR